MKAKVNTMMMRMGTAAVVLGMTLCGWSGDEWPDRSRVTFGTYCLSKRYRTEANFKDMKACGIDFVCENFGGDPQSIETMRKLGLVSVSAGGFPTYWGGVDSVNGHIAELAPLEKYEAARKAYHPSPVDRMVNFGDELSALDFPHLGRAMSLLAENGLRLAPYLNLHPCIHQGANVARYYGVSNYIAYVDAYVKHIPLDYISYDIYPYQFRERREWGFARFYENARIVADACRDSGRAFWFIPQANSFRPDDVTTANKMRHQAYAALAFGAETLTWACWTAGWWTNNVLNVDGKRTAQYDRLKEVIAEIHRFDRDYMRFRRVQTHFTGFTGAAAKWIEPDPKTGIPQVNFNTPHHVSTAFFNDIRGTDGLPLVVGEFVPRDGTGRERAILVFAADDPWDEHPADRVISFRTAYRVRVVGPDGEVKCTRSADGRYEIPLRSSKCAFVMGVPPTPVAKGKVAVVYFSWGGNTRFAAETIAKKACADIFEIKAETPYNSDFHKCCDEAKPECRGKALRPIKPITGLDLAKYDVVFVGTPDWWGTMAPPVRTWVTQSKPALKGKTVCLFQTHGGGGMERVGKAFAEVIGDTAKVLPPKAFAGSSIKSSVAALEAFVAERINVK